MSLHNEDKKAFPAEDPRKGIAESFQSYVVQDLVGHGQSRVQKASELPPLLSNLLATLINKGFVRRGRIRHNDCNIQLNNNRASFYL